MTFTTRLVMLVALASLATPDVRAGEGWVPEFEEGQAAARASGRDMLIDFGGSDWCLPCKWLKDRVFSRPEFIERANRDFVLIDIDLLLRDNAPISPDRKARYEQLQERYGIATFPSVLLTLPDGRPYARSTYRKAIETPELYWNHLMSLQERGRRLREALARAEKHEGRERAEALADGLAEVDARFVSRFYGDIVADLRKADPSDPTGYLAFHDGRQALDEFQSKIDLHDGPIPVSAVQSLISQRKLRGETLQEALVLRAAGEVLADEDGQALRTLEAVLDAQSSRTRFDHGDFVPLDDASIAMLRRRIAEGEAAGSDGLALDYALHRIFEYELPNAYEFSCGQGFRPDIRVRGVLGERYGRTLIRSTEGLSGQARASALAKGLKDTNFYNQGSICEIRSRLIPDLIGAKNSNETSPR